MLVDGQPIDDADIPEEALPDCHACEKPEPDPSNFEAIELFQTCANQQTWNQFSGERLGLRMEAVVVALDELVRLGRITNRERAFDRVWVIDHVVNDARNAELAAARKSKES